MITYSGPLEPTRARMWPQGSGYAGWSAFQPPPTATNGQQQWTQGPPPAMPPAGGPRKRAFICGINYLGSNARLSGCINDAKCMEYLLKSKFGFSQEQILLMCDDHPDPMRRPTRQNIYNGWAWLMAGLQPGDSLVFHYSGHGGQSRDQSGEEIDGNNETLLPMDFQQTGQILDDEINARLVNPLPQGVKLHAIIDSCHSGSVLDLPFSATVKNGTAQWDSAYHRPTRAWKGTNGGFCVQFSAALDSQTAADTARLSGGVATGAATFCFIKAVEDRAGQNLSYGDLLLAMWHTLHEAGLGTNNHPQSGAKAGGGSSLTSSLGSLLGGGSGGGKMGMVMQGVNMYMAHSAGKPGSSGGTATAAAGMLLSMLGQAGMESGGFKGQEPCLSANYAFDLGSRFSL